MIKRSYKVFDYKTIFHKFRKARSDILIISDFTISFLYKKIRLFLKK